MRKETRTVVYDDELRLEAYRLEGIVQCFPNHFHEYFVVGLIEGGHRHLCCKNKEYNLERGHLVLFNPGDNHACSPIGDSLLDYRALNIPQQVMLELAEEVTGKRELPGFSETIVIDEEIACCLHPLHEMIMNGSREFSKEEELLFLVSLLIQKYGQPFANCVPECREEIDKACSFLASHYAERISLDQICQVAGLSRSTLLRAFTRSKGVTPYRYLETVRVGEAKKLLEKGLSPLDAALQTGFSDQSHFTSYFSRFIGLTPAAYRDIFKEQTGGK